MLSAVAVPRVFSSLRDNFAGNNISIYRHIYLSVHASAVVSSARAEGAPKRSLINRFDEDITRTVIN